MTEMNFDRSLSETLGSLQPGLFCSITEVDGGIPVFSSDNFSVGILLQRRRITFSPATLSDSFQPRDLLLEHAEQQMRFWHAWNLFDVGGSCFL